MQWMILPLKRYFDFKGRSRRKEYWMYTLFIFLAAFVLTILDDVLGLGGSVTGATETGDTGVGASAVMTGGLLTNLFTLATFIPGLAVSVRRLHDLDRSGWWLLLPLGPIMLGAIMLGVGLMGAMSGDGSGMGGAGFGGMALIGIGVIASIVLLVWFCTAGTAGPNRFGEDPKGVHTDAEEVFG